MNIYSRGNSLKVIGKILISIYLILSFTGCGGGSITSSVTKTAYFVDSGVGGIPYYINGTYKGVTGANGSFEYTAGDTVTFKVGKITVGSFDTTNINSDGKILPQDIIGIPRGDTSNPQVLKMAQFLQSIDDDGDPSNGIVIPTATITTFDTLAVADLDTLNTLELKTVVATVGKTLKRIREVIQHLDNTVVSIGTVITPPSKPMLEGISISVDENITSNTIVGSITILNSGDENITSFTLNNTDTFTINSDGNISLKTGVSLDYETNTSYTLSVYATSSVGDSNVVNIDVNISNIADVAPTITGGTFSINENVSVGTVVATVDFTSGDSTVSVFTSDTYFNINNSGVITTKIAINYESLINRIFYVWAENDYDAVSASVTVDINDTNDAPDINTTFSNIDMIENSGTTNYTLNVSDEDGDELNIVVESNNTNILTVTQNWINNLNQAAYNGVTLDFNLTTVADAFGLVKITIVVNDGDKNDTTNFDLNIVKIFENGDTWKEKTYLTVTSPHTSKVWLDRNLGASMICTQSRDDGFGDDAAYVTSQENCFGDYYQWGRGADGHEKLDSSTTTVESSTITEVGNQFIISEFPFDWLDVNNNDIDDNGSLRSSIWSKIDGSSICPIGYRVPTITEIKAETIDVGVSNRDDIFNSFLKLPVTGRRDRDNGNIYGQGEYASIESSSLSAVNFRFISLNYSAGAIESDDYGIRANAYPVRCIKD